MSFFPEFFFRVFFSFRWVCHFLVSFMRDFLFGHCSRSVSVQCRRPVWLGGRCDPAGRFSDHAVLLSGVHGEDSQRDAAWIHRAVDSQVHQQWLSRCVPTLDRLCRDRYRCGIDHCRAVFLGFHIRPDTAGGNRCGFLGTNGTNLIKGFLFSVVPIILNHSFLLMLVHY